MLPVDAERVGLGFRRFWGAASGNVVFSIGEADTEGAIVRITQVQADRSAIAVVTNLRCARIRVAIAGEATNRRSEEHTSELQSLMRISYAVFCLKKKTTKTKEKQRMHT